jgi:fructokinase
LSADALDVVCVGEALVDFLPESAGRRVAEVEKWVRCSGGSPANVAVGLARLGARSALVGCVGKDEFGDFLRQSLAQEGVDVSRLRQTDEGKTGLVFVSLTERGERSFSFYRTRAAELFLGARDVDPAFLLRARAMHCGTNSLLWPDARAAVFEMVGRMREAGRIICCDPNLRLHLWADPGELQAVLRRVLPDCSVVKLSEEETGFVTGSTDVAGALWHLHRLGVPLPVVTRAEKGACFLWEGRVQEVPAPPAKVVDTTGAGDGFTAAFLYGITRLYADDAALRAARVEDLRALATFGCAVGTAVTEGLGAVKQLPRLGAVEALLPPQLRGRG